MLKTDRTAQTRRTGKCRHFIKDPFPFRASPHAIALTRNAISFIPCMPLRGSLRLSSRVQEHVLASKREMNSIEAEVKNKLYNINSGHWAEEINHKIPKKFHQLLPALATQTAHTATVRAFSRLKQQMLAAEKNPTFMQKLKPSDPKA
jgi:hypothetical protein